MSNLKPKVSKWAEWARARKAKHLCIRCPRKTTKYILCDRCHETELARKRLKSRQFLIRIPADIDRPVELNMDEVVKHFPSLEMERLTEAAPILSEICERLHELEDIRLGLAVDILSRFVHICEKSHTAFRFTIRLMHGDATIFDSFQEQADNREMSKQAAHAEFHSVIATIERAFPELAHQIEHIRGQVSRAEEAAHPRTNTQGMVVTAEREARA